MCIPILTHFKLLRLGMGLEYLHIMAWSLLLILLRWANARCLRLRDEQQYGSPLFVFLHDYNKSFGVGGWCLNPEL